MDNPIFRVPRSLQFAAGPIHFADGDGDSGGNDSGGGSSSDGQGSSGEGANVASHLNPSRLIQEHGDARQALGALSQKVDSVEADNADLRSERNELREQVPSDESIVVTPEKVQQLRDDGYLDAEDPSQDDLIGALQREREQRVTLENRQRFEEVVQITGANRSVLKDIEADTLDYVIEEGTDSDGNQVREAYVETEDGRTKFAEYVNQEFPSLAETILEGGAQSSTSQSFPDQPGGGGGQGGSGSSGPTTDVNEFIQNLNEERGRGDSS